MKLSKDLKAQIKRGVWTTKIKPLRENYAKKLKELVSDYIAFSLKEYKEFIESAPEGWLVKKNSFELSYNGDYCHADLGEPITIPWKWSSNYSARITVIEEGWIEKFKALDKENMSIQRYEDELMSEMSGFLAGISTDKQLLEQFPEIDQYVALDKTRFFAPVVQTDKLKELLARC